MVSLRVGVHIADLANANGPGPENHQVIKFLSHIKKGIEHVSHCRNLWQFFALDRNSQKSVYFEGGKKDRPRVIINAMLPKKMIYSLYLGI